MDAASTGANGGRDADERVLGIATLSRERPPFAALNRGRAPTIVGLVAGILSIALAVGTVVQCYRIGDSGAKAVWTGVVQK
jgi:hypothetical protein